MGLPELTAACPQGAVPSGSPQGESESLPFPACRGARTPGLWPLSPSSEPHGQVLRTNVDKYLVTAISFVNSLSIFFLIFI